MSTIIADFVVCIPYYDGKPYIQYMGSACTPSMAKLSRKEKIDNGVSLPYNHDNIGTNKKCQADETRNSGNTRHD